MDFLTLTQTLNEKLNLSSFPEEVRNHAITTLGMNILERTNLTIAETLNEDEAGLVNSMIKEGKVEEIMNFLSEKHPELDEKIAIISNDVVREFLEGTKS